jgi:phenylacetate-CoA ligase
MTKGSGCYYDRQEIRDPADREKSLFHALPGLLHHAIENTEYFARLLENIDPDTITSREALASLPVTRKNDLIQAQRGKPPLGGLTATAMSRLAHIYWSPGSLYDPEGTRNDYWRFARALFSAGVRQGDLVHNTFSYHMTPAGMMIDAAARSLGCPVFPAGTGQTDRQIEVIRDLRPKVFVGTPSFLLILFDRARELGVEIRSFEKALVSGEAFPAQTRDRLKYEHGIDAYQCYGTADAGLIAYESEAREGMVIDESLILEIAHPGTGTTVEPGEVGEIIVTLFNPDYPLIRYATGDLTRILPGESSCGRTNTRIAGWMGRTDQRTKVRGMFVDPEQIGRFSAEQQAIVRSRLVVTRKNGQDDILLRCEISPDFTDTRTKLLDSLRAEAQSALGLRCDIELVEAGGLPNDGKIVDDRRAVS